jgi:formyltetrahydrofolate synthetase
MKRFNFLQEIQSTFVSNELQVDLGIAVQKACENHNRSLQFLYNLDFSIKEKIGLIAKSYGAAGVEYSEQVTFYFPLFLCLCTIK